MNKDDQDKKFIDAVSNDLNKSVDDIDSTTQSRLTQIREHALTGQTKYSVQRWQLLTGALATACVVMLAIILLIRPEIDTSYTEDDVELFSTTDGLDFYEDLEFYVWLDEQEAST